MTERKRQDLSSLSGAYALHSLEEGEAAAFQAHAQHSQEARNEATELADTAVLLGLAVAPVSPPLSLKASIMAQVATTPQLGRETAPAPADAPADAPAQAKAERRWFARPLAAVAGIAAAVALIIAGGIAVSGISSGAAQRAEADRLAAIYSAADARSVRTPIEGGGQATLVYAGSLQTAALIVTGMPALSGDDVYELWYIGAEGAQPAGTFTVDADGTAWQVLEGTMAAGDTVGVTVEPRGGSEAPTTDPVLAIESS